MPSIPKARRLLIAFLATAGVWPASAVLAQVYKWTDADGQVHYSDRQPPPDAGQVEVIAAPAGENSLPQSQDELARIRRLAATLEADHKAREAERAALEEQRRQARPSTQPEEQASTQSDNRSGRRYFFGPSDPCYLYPNRCFPYYPQPYYPQPPVIDYPQSPVTISPRPPRIPPPPRERPYRPCPRSPQQHRGASSWGAGC